MVAKRRRKDPAAGLTEYERGLRALQRVPVSDEDPARFWGADWREKLGEAESEVVSGCTEFFGSTDEFLAALRATDREE